MDKSATLKVKTVRIENSNLEIVSLLEKNKYQFLCKTFRRRKIQNKTEEVYAIKVFDRFNQVSRWILNRTAQPLAAVVW